MATPQILKELTSLIPEIKKDFDLTDYNTWHLANTAEYFWEPDERIPLVLQFCSENNIRVSIIGRGSNILFEKKFTEGIVICTKKAFQDLNFENQLIAAGAGVPLPKIALFAAESGIGGFEFLIGIPGSVGGGVMTNAGLMMNEYREMKDVISSVETIDYEGKTKFFSKGEIEFGNRYCSLSGNNLFIKKVYLKSKVERSSEEIRKSMLRLLNDRKRKQPLSSRTAGSVFKRPEDGRPAGWYIENAGLKGVRAGGAKISATHANWIENENHATANDIINLIKLVKETVYNKYNVRLIEEVHYI